MHSAARPMKNTKRTTDQKATPPPRSTQPPSPSPSQSPPPSPNTKSKSNATQKAPHDNHTASHPGYPIHPATQSALSHGRPVESLSSYGVHGTRKKIHLVSRTPIQTHPPLTIGVCPSLFRSATDNPRPRRNSAAAAAPEPAAECRAVLPLASNAFMFTWWAARSLRQPRRPSLWQAMWSGVCPNLSPLSRSGHPFSSSLRTCVRVCVWGGLGEHISPVAPVAYQVILEPGIGQFREFEPPRVHTRINSWGDTFLCTKLTCGKHESVRVSKTLDEKSTSSGIAEPYAR